MKTLFIEPGSPWENGYCESFNGKIRDEKLSGELFYTLREAQVVLEMWRQDITRSGRIARWGKVRQRRSPPYPVGQGAPPGGGAGLKWAAQTNTMSGTTRGDWSTHNTLPDNNKALPCTT
ncbi:transposase [Desulfovibrio oxamicus]|uniref:Transposase n=1 Tax=Nitratidesulfovibrio oxamicus TaxID=32016 RepID=A0ABS0J1X5_9BACT|nr:transposase [Nitratidesulfovibrio oxamicus]